MIQSDARKGVEEGTCWFDERMDTIGEDNLVYIGSSALSAIEDRIISSLKPISTCMGMSNASAKGVTVCKALNGSRSSALIRLQHS